ncbi:uncharacterized protein [Zea mays]|uniref:uncharacterized protein isoform X2 n=1 Tax=Zea mays TaxID=4577 RepID=UPI0004DEC98D|nr:uncharacterized protein LOC103650376 isoform X2 [Zea mays]|eukprot:XP_008674181.1 uncharacterized protein LOC103650376 isoform X2 [Zea mays]
MEQQGQGWRRRQIPAFGRWNQHTDEAGYLESAVQAGLVRPGHCYHDDGGNEVVLFRSSASPPPHKPAKKVRSTMEGHGHHHQVQVEAGSRKQRPFVAGDGSRSRAAKPRPRVVRAAVDEDLYIVPSDMSRKKKGRKHVRSMWMGCVGLNCVA